MYEERKGKRKCVGDSNNSLNIFIRVVAQRKWVAMSYAKVLGRELFTNGRNRTKRVCIEIDKGVCGLFLAFLLVVVGRRKMDSLESRVTWGC